MPSHAKAHGIDDEIRSAGHSLNQRPVHLVFAGVKKVVECRLTPGNPELFSDGNEITYNEIVMETEADFALFVKGEMATLEIA